MKLCRKNNTLECVEQADPYIFKDKDGKYYVYTTGAHIFYSSSLKGEWQYVGDFLEEPEKAYCWGPCIIEIEGFYYLYYSVTEKDSEDHGQAIRVAVSDKASGPFGFKKKILPPFSIDPHVVKTPAGLFIFYCNNDYEAERVGTVIMCDKMYDPYTVEGRATCVVKPTIDEEIYQRDRFKEGEHWHTVEGAFYFFREGVHYLMYSGACYQNSTYFIGYCVAMGEEDTDLRTLDWKKYPDNDTYAPLFAPNDFVEGMGHNSVLCEDGKYYIIYHGRDKDMKEGEKLRLARIDELEVNKGRLVAEVTP
ncbi:MAG: family 43 glycosylhydrolase [Lachnospiraceae bacterium]|nr:family 43 glycosylhydrolase [Lachnospiraceae bacterium]